MNKDSYKIYTDGASRGNPGISGIGGVVYNENGDEFLSVSQYIGEGTNNYAEYEAIKRTLTELSKKDKNIDKKHIELYADSELVIRQLKGEYKIKNPNIRPTFLWIQKFIKDMNLDINFNHIVREENEVADRLANEGIDNRQ